MSSKLYAIRHRNFCNFGQLLAYSFRPYLQFQPTSRTNMIIKNKEKEKPKDSADLITSASCNLAINTRKPKQNIVNAIDKSIIQSPNPGLQTTLDFTSFEYRDSIEFIRSLPMKVTIPAKKEILPRKIRSSPKITLVLDLDETLVHCYTGLNNEGMNKSSEISFPVKVVDTIYSVNGKLRPYCLEFLSYCANHFEVVLFTASQKIYAQTLAKIIDPTGNLFKFRLFRDSCTLVEGHYIKNLDTLGRDLKQTVIVDNSLVCFGYHLDNVLLLIGNSYKIVV